MKKTFYTWKDLGKAAESIVLQMYKDNWRPDYIVGITRGGLSLALVLSHKLEIPMETLKVELATPQGDNCESNCWMADDAFGYVDDQETFKTRWDPSTRKKILVVDDTNLTGATFEWIKKDWQASCLPDEDAWNTVWGKNVRFAVITENHSSDFKQVAYYWDEVNTAEDGVSLVYPWEYEL